ncbi:MAG: hypothetical protein AB7H94_18575 [Lautropia sp.]
MSTTVTVHVPLGTLPTQGEIVGRALELGAVLQFPDGFDAARDDGYVPCVLCGQAAGFEYSAERRGASRRLTFEARSSYDDYAAAATVACAIALICGGSLDDNDSPELAGDRLVEWYKTVELPVEVSETELLRVPVTVQGPQGNSLLRLKLGRVPPGAHLMRALVQTIPVEQVPVNLRQPNSRFVLLVRDAHEIVGIEPI